MPWMRLMARDENSPVSQDFRHWTVDHEDYCLQGGVQPPRGKGVVGTSNCLLDPPAPPLKKETTTCRRSWGR